ncbi:unnamed protein product [Lepeophtheirus salmonis]|uniref:(salmon louse) hypothetical protein n=1 Tax=Lepeophtheirus salmonis TaxID=72036 RepID=A0A7R8HCH0_LEPSM|nr:unnamed protein product [Lepeophtheirus salmonis]CAF3015766.1 unnamed protein product [Lepeophtheirus salmonis]
MGKINSAVQLQKWNKGESGFDSEENPLETATTFKEVSSKIFKLHILISDFTYDNKPHTTIFSKNMLLAMYYGCLYSRKKCNSAWRIEQELTRMNIRLKK